MYLFDLKQKFTSKHPMPFTKTVGYFKSSFATKMVSINVTKYACLSFYHNDNHILPMGSDLWIFNFIYSVVKIHQYSIWRNIKHKADVVCLRDRGTHQEQERTGTYTILTSTG